MKWFKKLVVKWVRDDWNSVKTGNDIGMVASRDVESVSDADPILNFRVFNAIGGRVIEFRTYDKHKDRNYTQTYIITDDQDFGERIAKIATLESLKA
jgi:hypothetical protein